jgi:hypothetical protein
MSLILKKDQSRLKIYKSGPLVGITPTYLLFGMESSKYSDYAPLIDFKLVQLQKAALNT